jgi:hypothetical protein
LKLNCGGSLDKARFSAVLGGSRGIHAPETKLQSKRFQPRAFLCKANQYPLLKAGALTFNIRGANAHAAPVEPNNGARLTNNPNRIGLHSGKMRSARHSSEYSGAVAALQ